MAAQHEGGDVFNGHVEFLGEEIAETRRIQHAGHADHLVVRQARGLAQHPHHGVQGVGDADDESVRGVLLDAGADLGHDVGVGADQIVAAHARLTRDAGGDDDDVRAFDDGIIAAARIGRIDTLDRGAFGDIERLALRDAVGDVEQDDVAQLLQADQVGQGAANIAGTDECDFLAGHGNASRWEEIQEGGGLW